MKNIKQLAFGIYERMDEHSLSLIAAGVAFYAFLSIFPAIAACISVYGLVADPQSVQSQVQNFSGFLPPEVIDLIKSRMKDLANNQEKSLTMGLIFGVLVSIWSANKAMKAVAQGLNVAFEKEEDRGFIKKNLITLSLTLISSIVVIIVASVTVALPLLINYFLSSEAFEWLAKILSWLVLALLLLGLCLVLYRYAPARDKKPKLKDSMPGAIFTTIAILIGSIIFSVYVANFGKYEEEYGAIAGVVVTLLWLFLSSFLFLLGAEFNGESGELVKTQRALSHETKTEVHS